MNVMNRYTPEHLWDLLEVFFFQIKDNSSAIAQKIFRVKVGRKDGSTVPAIRKFVVKVSTLISLLMHQDVSVLVHPKISKLWRRIHVRIKINLLLFSRIDHFTCQFNWPHKVQLIQVLKPLDHPLR